MSKEATKKFIENNGFICNKCAKVVVDGTKHKNEEDLCDHCKIADLEAKLAESEKEVNRFKSMKNREQLIKENEALKDTIAIVLSQKSEWIKSCNELKQKLAEKEKELEQYKNNWYIDIDSLKINENVQKIANQKVIYELEKVKEYWLKHEDIGWYIDNQIKQLKENKDGKDI